MVRRNSTISGHHRFLLDQVVDVVALAAESTNRERRTVERQRRNDRIDTRTVGQPRVNHRRRFVNPASDLRDDSIDDQHQVLIVLELDLGGVELAALFDVNLVVSVDQDIGDLIVPQKRLERPESEQLVFDFFYKMSLVGVGEQPSLVVENGGDRLGDFLRGEHRLEAFKPRNVEHLEQTIVDSELELLKSLGLRVFDLYALECHCSSANAETGLAPWCSAARSFQGASLLYLNCAHR